MLTILLWAQMFSNFGITLFPGIDEDVHNFLDQRKHDEMQWLRDPDQSNVDKLNNVRHEASRHFSNKKKDSLKASINEHETDSKNNNITDCTGASVIYERLPV